MFPNWADHVPQLIYSTSTILISGIYANVKNNVFRLRLAFIICDHVSNVVKIGAWIAFYLHLRMLI